LEETGTNGDKNYAYDFFEKATGYRNLENMIQNNKLSCLLSALTEHFNGGIFDIDETFKQRLNNSDIRSLAQFFDAGYKTDLFGWKEYSFEHIPVELISNFYEEFIPQTTETIEKNRKNTGAVYTPSFLVNLLIDECLPLDNLDENVKLIDPTCGSGIFLVTAYKRLVQRWRPVMMTATVAVLGLVPASLSTGIGSDVQRPLATVIVYGLLCDALCAASVLLYAGKKEDKMNDIFVF
jgi:type I restriction-modification system DNA methylase subunit